MGVVHLNSHVTLPSIFNFNSNKFFQSSKNLSFSRRKIRATVGTVSGGEPQVQAPDDPPSIEFAFVSSVLLPDGTPDVHLRSACGGQKLRDIMLDSHIDLYGPYARPLLNCAGGGTCATCIVEVVEGKELMNPRTEKEKEKLRRKPKTWRLACQTTVGNQDSRGQVIIQQLPEWKAHEWTTEKYVVDEVNNGAGN